MAWMSLLLSYRQGSWSFWSKDYPNCLLCLQTKSFCQITELWPRTHHNRLRIALPTKLSYIFAWFLHFSIGWGKTSCFAFKSTDGSHPYIKPYTRNSIMVITGNKTNTIQLVHVYVQYSPFNWLSYSFEKGSRILTQLGAPWVPAVGGGEERGRQGAACRGEGT